MESQGKNEKKFKFIQVGMLLLVFFLSIMILLFPYFLREMRGNLEPIGSAPYYNMRVISNVLEGKHLMWDSLVFEGRLIQVNLFHIVFSQIARFVPLDMIAIFAPPIFGIISILIFYFILRRTQLSQTHVFFSLLVLIVSSNFIYPFITFSSSFFSIFLFLLGMLLYSVRRTWAYVCSVIIFILISLTGFLDAIVCLLMLLAFHFLQKEEIKRYVLLSGLSLVAITAFNVPFILFRGWPNLLIKPDYSLITKMFSELGGVQGYNFLILMLSFLGIILLWANKRNFLASYLTLSAAFVLSIFFIDISPYLSFAFAILCGVTIKEISYRKWKLELIKNLTILLLVCTLIFSIITYLIMFSTYPPNKEIVQGLNELNTISSPDDLVLSHPDNGFWIEEVSNRMVLLDNFPDYIKNSKEKYNDTFTIFYSRNLEATKLLLDKYYVKYIFIEPSMFDGKVWVEKDEGLTFLFRDNETFRNVYSNNGVEIWEYIKT